MLYTILYRVYRERLYRGLYTYCTMLFLFESKTRINYTRRDIVLLFNVLISLFLSFFFLCFTLSSFPRLDIEKIFIKIWIIKSLFRNSFNKELYTRTSWMTCKMVKSYKHCVCVCVCVYACVCNIYYLRIINRRIHVSREIEYSLYLSPGGYCGKF